jgi:hypothetical protein
VLSRVQANCAEREGLHEDCNLALEILRPRRHLVLGETEGYAAT